jgi:hypothetical protein
MIDQSSAPLRFSRARLHHGPDLAHAFERSVKPPAPTGQLRAAVRALYDSVVDKLNAPSLREAPVRVAVTGIERSSGTTMRILFHGQKRSIYFCASHILGTEDFKTSTCSTGSESDYDVAIADYPFVERDFFDRRPALRVPLWLRQRCALGETWEETLGRMSGSLRKRIARVLGNSGYGVRVESGPLAAHDFYHRMYLPFVMQRFGDDAIVPAERSFLRQAESSGILQLRLGDKLVGAVLVKQLGDTLFIGKSAVALEHAIPYRSDLLDYFCFLLAQLCGCRWLDFGVSRPHIEDGVFVNKSKWRPKLAPAGGLRTSLRIRPTRNTPATIGFLRRNGFIEERGSEFLVRRLEPEHALDSRDVARTNALVTRCGLDAMIMVPCSGTDPLRALLQFA